jgi:hypothetical protein
MQPAGLGLQGHAVFYRNQIQSDGRLAMVCRHSKLWRLQQHTSGSFGYSGPLWGQLKVMFDDLGSALCREQIGVQLRVRFSN